MLFRQILFAKTLKFFISVMDFKEICQTLLIQIDFLAKLSSFTVLSGGGWVVACSAGSPSLRQINDYETTT